MAARCRTAWFIDKLTDPDKRVSEQVYVRKAGTSRYKGRWIIVWQQGFGPRSVGVVYLQACDRGVMLLYKLPRLVAILVPCRRRQIIPVDDRLGR